MRGKANKKKVKHKNSAVCESLYMELLGLQLSLLEFKNIAGKFKLIQKFSYFTIQLKLDF